MAIEIRPGHVNQQEGAPIEIRKGHSDIETTKSFTDTFGEHLSKILSENPLPHIREASRIAGNELSNFGGGFGYGLQQDIKNAISSVPTPLMHALAPSISFLDPSRKEILNSQNETQGISGKLGELASHIAGFSSAGAMSPNILKSIPGVGNVLGKALGAGVYGGITSNPGEGLIQGPEASAISLGVDTLTRTPGLVGNILKAKGAFQKKADNILEDLKGSSKEHEIPKVIFDDIKKNKNIAKQSNRELYEDFTESAKLIGAKIKMLPNSQKVARNFLFDPDKKLPHAETKILANYVFGRPQASVVVTERGPKIEKDLSFSRAYEKMKDFGKKSRSLEKSDPYLSSMYGQLRDSISQDMKDSALRNGNPRLYNKLLNAMRDYKENVLPYNQSPIGGLLKGKKDLEKIPNLLLKDIPERNKILEDLPTETRKKLAYLKFSKSIEESPETKKYISDPESLFNEYNKLSEKQKTLLFSNKERDSIRKMGVLKRYMPKDFEPDASFYRHLKNKAKVLWGLGVNPIFRNTYISENPLEFNQLTKNVQKALQKGAVGASLGEE